ncbi:MAG: transcriptional repressor [Actinomycetota bacterium]|nr:MAG: transcriptional repressor [Actinomycetota bacterium]
MKLPAELTTEFRANGLKLTPQRQLLFRLLHGNETHPTADSLYAAASAEMPGISLRTVYQTLTDLVAMGELRLLDLGAGASRFDPNVDEHQHLVCDTCSAVRDVYVTGAEQLDLADLAGFEVESTAIVFRGQCASCAGAARDIQSVPAVPAGSSSPSSPSSPSSNTDPQPSQTTRGK